MKLTVIFSPSNDLILKIIQHQLIRKDQIYKKTKQEIIFPLIMPVELHKVNTCVPASVQLELNFTKRGNVFTLLIMKLRLKCQNPRHERRQNKDSNALWQSCSKSTQPRVTTEINKYLGYTSQKGQVHPISGLPPTVLPTNTP